MALPESSLILFFVSVSVFTHCPFYRNTRKGIATFHWVLLYWLSSCSWDKFSKTDFTAHQSLEILLGGATLLLFALGTLNRFTGDSLKTCSEQLKFIALIFALDALVFFGFRSINATKYLTFVFITSYICLTLLTRPMEAIRHWDSTDLEKIENDSFFIDCGSPLNCLGRSGYLNIWSITCRLAMLLLPELYNVSFFVYVVYITSSLSAWLMICTPAHLGGMTLVAKSQFRYWTGQSLESNLKLSFYDNDNDDNDSLTSLTAHGD